MRWLQLFAAAVAPAAATTILINFQCPDPSGANTTSIDGVEYLIDAGDLYGARAERETYGWDCDLVGSQNCRTRGATSDAIADTMAVLGRRSGDCAGGRASWSISLPNGMYTVGLSFADPSFPGTSRDCMLQCDNLGLIEVPREPANTLTRTAAVTDGRLTFAGGYAIGCSGINAISIASSEASSSVETVYPCPSPSPPPPYVDPPPGLPPPPPSSPKKCKRGREDCGGATWAGAMLGGIGGIGIFLILAIGIGQKQHKEQTRKRSQRQNEGAPKPANVMPTAQPAAVTTPMSLKQKSERIAVELDIPSGTVKEIVEMAAAELGIDPADRPLATVADECMAALNLAVAKNRARGRVV